MASRSAVVLAFVALIVGLLTAMGLALLRREAPGFAGFGINAVGRAVEVRARPAPTFTLAPLGGGPINLADLRGQPVVVNFWASWCPPCREEAPALEAAWRAHQAEGVVFVGVNLWDQPADAQAFLHQFGVTYLNGVDATGAMAIEYGVTGIPETFGINREGMLVKRWVGPMNLTELRAFVEAIQS